MMKEVVLVRIDERLIHGQIIESWLPHTMATTIVIINDELSRDCSKKKILKSSVPRTIAVKIEGLQEGLEYIMGMKDEEIDSDTHGYQKSKLINWIKSHGLTHGEGSERIIVIFSNLKDAMLAYQKGFHFKELNLGNIHDINKTISLTPSVYLNGEDMEIVKELSAAGVKMDLRAVPSDRPLRRGKGCLL